MITFFTTESENAKVWMDMANLLPHPWEVMLSPNENHA
jgi:hypothetical protein